MSKIITIRLPEEVSEKLDDLSLEIRRKKSFIIKSALEQYLMSMQIIRLLWIG